MFDTRGCDTGTWIAVDRPEPRYSGGRTCVTKEYESDRITAWGLRISYIDDSTFNINTTCAESY